MNKSGDVPMSNQVRFILYNVPSLVLVISAGVVAGLDGSGWYFIPALLFGLGFHVSPPPDGFDR